MALRILMVSDHYPPFIGGAHRQTQLLAKELSNRGHEVKVATVWHDGFPAQANEAGVKVVRLKQIRTALFHKADHRQQRYQPPFPDPITVFGLRKLINEFNPDIIHSYGWISYSCAVALIGKEIPLLISARDYGYSCATRTLIFSSKEACSGPRFSKCLSCASNLYGSTKGWTAVLGLLASQGLLRSKIRGVHSISTYVQQIMQRDFWHMEYPIFNTNTRQIPEVVIPSFQENDADASSEVERGIESYVSQLPTEPFILFVGALRRVKGVNQLLEAYRQLNRAPPLVLIGTVEWDTPRDFPPGVTVLKDFPHRAVMHAWEKSLFGVIPSLWPEPLGSVVYEGMSKSKAIIGTTPGGHTDMILDNESGFLVPSGDVNALTAAMQKLIDDPELCRRFGKTGLERARSYRAEVAVPSFEKFYKQLIQEHQQYVGLSIS
jgi:glycosyltransferase involved in cell wall biosynthesis